jgi:hypothetical protein
MTLVTSIVTLSTRSPAASTLSRKLALPLKIVCTSLIIEGMPVVASSTVEAAVTALTMGAAAATTAVAVCTTAVKMELNQSCPVGSRRIEADRGDISSCNIQWFKCLCCPISNRRSESRTRGTL